VPEWRGGIFKKTPLPNPLPIGAREIVSIKRRDALYGRLSREYYPSVLRTAPLKGELFAKKTPLLN